MVIQIAPYADAHRFPLVSGGQVGKGISPSRGRGLVTFQSDDAYSRAPQTQNPRKGVPKNQPVSDHGEPEGDQVRNQWLG